MNKLVGAWLVFLIAIGTIVAPAVSLAGNVVPNAQTLPGTAEVNNLATIGLCVRTGDNDNLGATITYLICVIRIYATAIAVLIIMVVGIMYILGAFKPDAAGAAKTILTTTITGLVFMYLISLIINFLVLTGVLTNVT